MQLEYADVVHDAESGFEVFYLFVEVGHFSLPLFADLFFREFLVSEIQILEVIKPIHIIKTPTKGRFPWQIIPHLLFIPQLFDPLDLLLIDIDMVPVDVNTACPSRIDGLELVD